MRRACLLLISLLPFAAPAGEKSEFARVLAAKPDLRHGEVLFQQCTGCHGAAGAGEVSGSVPRIAGQHYRVLVRQIVDFRRGKRWDPRMEGVAKSHEVLVGAQDIADVAAWVGQLGRDGARGVGDGEYREKGAQIYAARCARCHGTRGEGDDAGAVPKLAGQHAAYLSRQIYDAVDGRRPALAKSHGRMLAPLAFDEVRGLADYLSREGWQAD